MINLTDEERRKFSLWLRQDAESNRLIIEQLSKLPHATPIVKAKERDVMACLIVARMIDSSEEQTISATKKLTE